MQPDLFNQAPGNNPIIFATKRTTKRKSAPYYYRCVDCLTVVATEEKLPTHPKHYACGQAKCACESDCMEFLGKSGPKKRLEKTVKLCPCDARCTGAQGPNCDCQCGGVNHGSDLLIEVVRDCGPVPVLKMKNPEMAKLERRQWEQAKLDARGRMEATHGAQAIRDFETGKRIDDAATWNKIRYAKQTLREAQGLRSMRGRMARLATICPVSK